MCVCVCKPGKSQAPVFDVFEAFINTDNIQVFANAATDYIMCLMKFVKGLGESGTERDLSSPYFGCLCGVFVCIRLCLFPLGEVDYKEIGDCINASTHSSTDLCLPALDYLRKCSQVGTIALKSISSVSYGCHIKTTPSFLTEFK